MPIKSNLFCWTVQKPQKCVYIYINKDNYNLKQKVSQNTDRHHRVLARNKRRRANWENNGSLLFICLPWESYPLFCEINGNHFPLFTTVLGSNYNSGRFRYNIAVLLCSTFSLSITVLILKYWERSINSVSENTLSCIAKEGTMPPEIRRAWKSKNLLCVFFFPSKVLIISISTGTQSFTMR